MEKSIGNLIEDKRTQLDLTQAEMGVKLGISSQLLGQYERGRQKPKVDFHQKWKEVFGDDLIKTNVSQETIEELKFKIVYVQRLTTLYQRQ